MPGKNNIWNGWRNQVKNVMYIEFVGLLKSQHPPSFVSLVVMVESEPADESQLFSQVKENAILIIPFGIQCSQHAE